MKRLTEAIVLRGSVAAAAAHDRGQDHPALLVGQAVSRAAAHGSNQRIGGAEIDACRKPVLVRLGGQAGLGDLQ
jgi:hypothetical protein